jgi:hypothetical protein
MKQYGTYRYVRTASEIEQCKPIVLRGFAYGVASHRLRFPESYKWIITLPKKDSADPYDLLGSVGIKANCEHLPWHKGWLEMFKARWWLRRHHAL